MIWSELGSARCDEGLVIIGTGDDPGGSRSREAWAETLICCLAARFSAQLWDPHGTRDLNALNVNVSN
jgi:hypothetical protein